MLKSLIIGCLLQGVIWLISFFMGDLGLADTLSFYLVGACVLLAAMLSITSLGPDTSTAYFHDQSSERKDSNSRFRWTRNLILLALPSLVVYILLMYFS